MLIRFYSLLILVLLLAFGLLSTGCYTISRGSGSQDGSDDDDNDSEPTDDDDSDVTDDDDDVTDDDDSNSSDDDDDTLADDDDTVADDDDATPNPSTPAFQHDCTEQLNDTIGTVSGLAAIDGQEYLNVEACAGDTDWYQVDVPPESWVSVEIVIDGSGSGSTDLDLYEVNTASEGMQVSWSTQNYERLAVHNPSTVSQPYYFTVVPYDTAVANYDIVIGVSDWDQGLDCDAYYSNTSETGPCNANMQYPRANTEAEGYFVEHQPHYSNLRREVAYLVAYATEATYAQFSGTNPLALMDMSEDDGSTPGAMVGSLRHPEGTHINGNDIDIAYYQTGPDNSGRPVCTQNDGYFCTGPADLLDAQRTAYFMAKLFDSSQVRVIGVDTTIATDILAAADALRTSGLITQAQRSAFDYLMAYGSGWPFHHHHMHFSWVWEGSWERDLQVDGCMVAEPVGLQTKVPFFSMP